MNICKNKIKFDFYTKFIITVIALCLMLNMYMSSIKNVSAEQDSKMLAQKEALRVLNALIKKESEQIRYSRNLIREVKAWKLGAPRATAFLLATVIEQNDILANINASILRILAAPEETPS